MPKPKNLKKYRGSDVISYGGRWFYWLSLEATDNKYLGYHSIHDLFDLSECTIKFSVLRSRLQYYRNVGNIDTTIIWKCVTHKTEELKKSKENKAKDLYSIEINKLMKLWPLDKNKLKQTLE